MTTRVYPPVGGANHDIGNGMRIVGVEGVSQDIADQYAPILGANGWTITGQVGTTAQRPTKPVKTQRFVDTTVGVVVMWDGNHWRNEVTNAIT